VSGGLVYCAYFFVGERLFYHELMLIEDFYMWYIPRSMMIASEI